MKTCIYSRQKFSKSTGEHILQNFLGARWASHEIVCNEVQSIFGQSIDTSLEQGLRNFRNLLGTKGGRGGEAPDLKHLHGSAGNHFHLQSGGVPYFAKPSIKTRTIENGVHDVEIKVSDMRQFDWALAELALRFPEAKLDIEKFKSSAKVKTEYLSERLQLRSAIGGRDYFRGLLKAAFNLLGANATEIALHPCFDAIRTFVLTGTGDIAEHIRWPNFSTLLSAPTLGRFDHVIAIHCRNGTVEGVVEFFGGVGHLVRLSDNYDGKDFAFGYRVNPLRNSNPAEIRNPSFDRHLIPTFDHGHEEPNEEARSIYATRMNRFLSDHSELAIQNEIAKIVNEVLTPHEGKSFSEEILNELTHRFSFFLESLLFRNRHRKKPHDQEPNIIG